MTRQRYPVHGQPQALPLGARPPHSQQRWASGGVATGAGGGADSGQSLLPCALRGPGSTSTGRSLSCMPREDYRAVDLGASRPEHTPTSPVPSPQPSHHPWDPAHQALIFSVI